MVEYGRRYFHFFSLWPASRSLFGVEPRGFFNVRKTNKYIIFSQGVRQGDGAGRSHTRGLFSVIL